MNLLKDFAWIGEKTRCLARELMSKNYDFYTGCKYMSNEFEIGSAVTIKYNNKFHVGIIHYFYDIPHLELADKYRVAVELYYRPKDLKIHDNTTLHFDFELLKQDKPILTFLPIANIKSRCSIVYGLEDEKPEELLREFSDTTSDVIYVCRFIAAPNRNNHYSLRGVVHNTIEISDDEVDPVNVAEIEVSSPSATKPIEHKDNKNDNIHIKIHGFQIDVSNQSDSVRETNNTFTISNVGDANKLKLKFTRTKNVSSVLVESSFTNKPQNEVKATQNIPKIHSVNAQLSITKNTAKVSQNESNVNPDQIFTESSTNQDNESENVNLQSPKETLDNQTVNKRAPKQTFKKISLSHLFTDNQPESDSSYELYDEIDSEPLENDNTNRKITPILLKKRGKKSPAFYNSSKYRIDDLSESDSSKIVPKLTKKHQIKSTLYNDLLDSDSSYEVNESDNSENAPKLAKEHQTPLYKRIQTRTSDLFESDSSSDASALVNTNVGNSCEIAPKLGKKHQTPLYKRIQTRTSDLLESDSSSDASALDNTNVGNSCEIAPKLGKKHQTPLYKRIQTRTSDLLESDSSSEASALDNNTNVCSSYKIVTKLEKKHQEKSPFYKNKIDDLLESDTFLEASEHINALVNNRNSSKLVKKHPNMSLNTHVLKSEQAKSANVSSENNQKFDKVLPCVNVKTVIDNNFLPEKHVLNSDYVKENRINEDNHEFMTSEASPIVLQMPQIQLIEHNKSNPVVLVKRINLNNANEMDKMSHKRDIVRESLLNDLNNSNNEKRVRKSVRLNKKPYNIENRFSLDSQESNSKITDTLSDPEFLISESMEDSLNDEVEVNKSERKAIHEEDQIFETYSLRSKTPTSTRVLRSKSQTKENASPHRESKPLTKINETKFKKTESSQRTITLKSRAESVSETKSPYFETSTPISNSTKSKIETNLLKQKKVSLNCSSNEPNEQCEIKSEFAVEEVEISKTVHTKSKPESNSLSKYELRPKTPVILMDIDIKTPKRRFSRVKFVEECDSNPEVKSCKKNRIEGIEKITENVRSTRTSMRGKRIVNRIDSSEDDFRTPKKQPKQTPLLKGTPKSVRILLKNMTPGIEERDEALATCSTPMRRARIGLSAHCVPTNMPCREKEYINIYNFITGKITDKSSGCMYISGVPGTGKTMTVFKVMQNITENTSYQSVTFLKLNALALTEPRQIYVEIVKLLISKTLHWEAALNEIQRFFKSKKDKRPHILLIDELDKLCNRKQDVIYNLLDLPFHSKIPLVVITIANTMDLPERILTNKVNSRLGLTRLTFKPYQFKELVQIVTARLSNEKVFKPEALELVARKVAAVSGDARRALAMCTRATEIAEEETLDLVNMDIINRVMFEMISSSSSQAVKSCSKIEQFILTAISNEVLRTGNEEVPFVSMLENLKKLCYLEKVTVPGAGMCLKSCQRLGSFRLLITQHARFDLNMTLMLNISPDDIHFALR